MEEIQARESWDPKKILVALVVLAVTILGFKMFVLENKSQKAAGDSVSVQGIRVFESPTPTPVISNDIKKSVEIKLTDLKKEVNNINVVEIATSTPAVQKVLNDLKNLQNLPQSQAKEACFKICSGF